MNNKLIQYLKFSAGSTKGGVKQGDLFNDVFRLGAMTEGRMNYTGATVVEEVKEAGKVAWMQGGKVAVYAKAKAGDTEKSWCEGCVLKAGEEVATKVEEVQVGDKISYIYNNIEIPQRDIPQLTAEMDGIELSAKARRIGIYYSQMSAFQAKTEMGIDLGEVLATQACGELSYK